MKENTIEILLAEPRLIKFGELTIEVREISWPDLLGWLELFAVKSGAAVAVDAQGRPSIDLTKLPELVKGSRELSELLIAATTNVLKDTVLPARVFLALVDTALAVNLTEEFLKTGKSVAARLQAVLPAPAKTPSAASSKA